MITKKSISAELPNVATLRKYHVPSNHVGWLYDNQSMLGSAFADVYNGAFSVRIYDVGDAMEPRDYHGESISITDIIEGWIAGEYQRADVVSMIAARVNGTKREG